LLLITVTIAEVIGTGPTTSYGVPTAVFAVVLPASSVVTICLWGSVWIYVCGKRLGGEGNLKQVLWCWPQAPLAWRSQFHGLSFNASWILQVPILILRFQMLEENQFVGCSEAKYHF